MAHTLSERYSQLVDKKLRQTLVTKDNLIFNTRYEGDAKSGVVKIPVRDTEVSVRDYNKTSGLALEGGTTTYLSLQLNKDVAVNELIDGFEAQAVPDNIVADRIESAGYSLGLKIDKDSLTCLETGGTKFGTTTVTDKTNAYDLFMKARTQLSKNGVPKDNRFAIVSPEVLEVLMQDSSFIKEGDLSQELVMQGVVGRVGGFNVFESCNMGATTEVIFGHSDYCHRVEEWSVPVKVQDLGASGTFIGASAVQGRKVYGVLVSKQKAVLVKSKGGA